jgi:ketosteroid isomerase-like protein
MSQENVEIVGAAVTALQHGDFDGAFASADPEIEWEEMPSLGPDAAVYRGVGSAREALESWRAMWSDYETETSRLVDAGDDVVALSKEQGRGRDSGVAAERELGIVATLRDGEIVRVRLFGSWAEALEAAGLSE